MTVAGDLVFLIDVDGTLFDSDALKRAFGEVVECSTGASGAASRFWECYEAVRASEGVVDWVETIARFSASEGVAGLAQRLQTALWDLPFPTFVYPGAIETLRFLSTLGHTVILSDGRPPFQTYKIGRSGLGAAVAGRVLVYPRKVDQARDIRARFPARRYVIVDDRPEVLDRLGSALGACTATVLVKRESRRPIAPERAGIGIARFTDLLDLPLTRLPGC